MHEATSLEDAGRIFVDPRAYADLDSLRTAAARLRAEDPVAPRGGPNWRAEGF
jgi:hypothetical protein